MGSDQVAGIPIRTVDTLGNLVGTYEADAEKGTSFLQELIVAS